MRKYSITSEIIRKAASGTEDKFGKDSEVRLRQVVGHTVLWARD